MRFLIAAQLMLFVPESEVHSQIPCRYDVTVIRAPDCGKLGPSVTFATGINNLDPPTVVGSWRPCAFGDDQPYYWTEEEGFQAVQVPKGISGGRFTDVNDHNIAVGTYNRIGIGQRGFVYDINTGEWTEIEPHPGGAWSSVAAINASGTVCGTRSIGSKGDPVNPRTAYLWSKENGYFDIGVLNGPDSHALDISDNGTVVGWTGPHRQLLDEDTRGFIHKKGITTVLAPVPNGVNSIASAVNNNGEVILGGSLKKSEELLSASFLFKEGIAVLLPFPAEFDRFGAVDINDTTMMGGAVSHSSRSQVFHPTVWSGSCVYLVEEFVDQPSVLIIGAVTAISEGGTLVARSTESNDPVGVVLKPVWPASGDTDCNQIINVDDLGNVFIQWGKCECCSSDLTGDGLVDHNELMMVIDNWSRKR